MGTTSIGALWKMLTSLSVSEALLLGFLVLCAVGGTITAIFIGVRAAMDFRKERRTNRPQPGPRSST
jgi:hypothetical protein